MTGAVNPWEAVKRDSLSQCLLISSHSLGDVLILRLLLSIIHTAIIASASQWTAKERPRAVSLSYGNGDWGHLPVWGRPTA